MAFGIPEWRVSVFQGFKNKGDPAFAGVGMREPGEPR
jgi:hypothetical protein